MVRGRNISIILTCLVMAYAIDTHCYMIVSETNDISGSLLENKFGFTRFNEMDYTSNLGTISMGIMKEFNCYYYLTEPSLINTLQSKIHSALTNCSLSTPYGGYTAHRRKTTKPRKRKSVKKRKQTSKRSKKYIRK
jgi:hypothetical protein